MLRRALTAEELALMWLEHAFQNFTALGCPGIGDANSRHIEALLGVELGIGIAQP